MRKLITVISIILLVSAPGAFGSLWTYYDFGDPFDFNNNWSPINYPNIGHLPSPGYYYEGGEGFDLEGGFAAADETYLYFGLTNSFGLQAYSTSYDKYYDLGALFFGFNGANTEYALFDFGVDRAVSLAEVWDYDLIPSGPGCYGGDIRLQAGAFMPTDGLILGGVDFTMAMHPDLEPNPLYPSQNGDTWLLEFRVAKSLFTGIDFSTVQMISIHQTIACGNDLLEKDFDIVPSDIPEPSTLLLLGVGLLGAGVARRIRK